MNPPRVDNIETFWQHAPPERSPRCAHWLTRFDAGWRPNRRIAGMGYYESAEYYGVYIWEYINVISPRLVELDKIDRGAEGIDCEMCADSGLMSTLNAKGNGMDVVPCLCERGQALPERKQ